MGRRVVVVGLGPGSAGLMTVETRAALEGARSVVLRTGRHPAAEELAGWGIRAQTCDDLYEAHGSFEAVYAAVVRRVLEAAAREGEVVYAVPGDPRAAERTVRMLLEEGERDAELEVRVLPALGALDLLMERMDTDPGEGLIIADARSAWVRPAGEAPQVEERALYHGARRAADPTTATLWLQVDTRMVAGNLKIALLEQYPPEHMVTVMTGLGSAEERVERVELAEMDRGPALTHLTSVYVPALAPALRRHTFQDLRAIMALLRSERGCPWDREQDMLSLRRSLIEEAYEAAEAMTEGDPEKIADELGDLLLNVYFAAQLGAEEGTFDVDDVAAALASKLIRRHPHVFGDAEAETPKAVLHNWETIKAGERARDGQEGRFDDVAAALPALVRAQKLQKRAARVGFDWADFRGPLRKLHEELLELSEEVGVADKWEVPPVLADEYGRDEAAQARAEGAPRARTTHEMGDLLFAATNLCRFLHLDAEEALREANERFVRRFGRVEEALAAEGKSVEGTPLEELDAVWSRVKGKD